MKRILATALAVLLIATMAISGSVAYLTSTDNAENTFTVGDVEIKQHEQERGPAAPENSNPPSLDDFTDNHPLLPGHEFREGNTPVRTEFTIGGAAYKFWKTEAGAVDKIVTVENTGENAAYVRTIFAFEDTAEIATNDQIWLNWNRNDTILINEIAGRVLINGEYYRLYEYIYNNNAPLAAGNTTAPSLLQVAMDAKVGNDIVDAIAATEDGVYTILVATQAVQADNMMVKDNDDDLRNMTAEEALDAAFYDVTSENNPWTKGEVEDSEAENAGNVIYLNSKADVLAKLGGLINTDTTFILNNDIDMGGATLPTTAIDDNGTINNTSTVKFIGNGYTISNVVLTPSTHNGGGLSNIGLFDLFDDHTGSSKLTIENLKLKKVSISGEVANQTIGAAAVVGMVNGGNTVILNNVDVYDSNIENGEGNASVFVGYAVGSNVTMNNCGAYNCTIKGDTSQKTGAFVGTVGLNSEVTINSCVKDVKNKHGNGIAADYGRKAGPASAGSTEGQFNGTGMLLTTVSTAENMQTALNNGGAISMTSDVELAMPDITADTKINLNGKTMTVNGNVFELENNADLSINGGTYHAKSSSAYVDVRPTTEEGSTLTFEGMTFENTYWAQNGSNSTNCVNKVLQFTAQENNGKATAYFKNCTFNNAKVYFNGLSGKITKFDVTFDNCTFNALTYDALIEVENNCQGKITLKNCTFNIKATSPSASAVAISSNSSTSVELNIGKGNVMNVRKAVYGDLGDANVFTKGDIVPANLQFASYYSNTTVNGTVPTANVVS